MLFKTSHSVIPKNSATKHKLHYRKGQNIAIIGESGCGKSTLLKLIYGVHDLHEGHIFWNETSVRPKTI
jgi:ABC-type nitrate/sulfonate/bicarbonate transport system ATPase subunit